MSVQTSPLSLPTPSLSLLPTWLLGKARRAYKINTGSNYIQALRVPTNFYIIYTRKFNAIIKCLLHAARVCTSRKCRAEEWDISAWSGFLELPPRNHLRISEVSLRAPDNCSSRAQSSAFRLPRLLSLSLFFTFLASSFAECRSSCFAVIINFLLRWLCSVEQSPRGEIEFN